MSLDALLAAGLVLEPSTTTVAGGATWSEGPVWVPSTSPSARPGAPDELWWSDIPARRILALDPATGQVRVVVSDSEFANGRTLDLDGRVVQCSHGRRAIETLVDDGSTTGLIEVLTGAPGPRGATSPRLNSPNDVVVATDGTIWFTDPPYGIIQAHEGHPGEREYGGNYVFRFDPVSGETTAVVTDMEEPNGLAFNEDQTVLYVADSGIVLGNGVNHHIRAYPVESGTCGEGRTFAVIEPGIPDGFRVDERGNVWTSSKDSVQVFRPDGTLIGRIPVDEVVGNLCFGGTGGRTLFIAASSGIRRIETSVRDAAAVLRAARVGAA
jgi:gluconolactonase